MAGNQAYTVSAALNAAKRSLEQIRLTVIGEVSEVSDKPGYKAVYFSIRDDRSTMSCIMWHDRYYTTGLSLKVGMLVELVGRFSCYTAKGRMQFSVDRISLAGEGRLRMQVAQIARKLQAEGLMAPERKRPLPVLPERIAVVTSPRGKAVHDVLRTLRRRYPLGEVLVFGVPVEGRDAPRFLCEGLARANAYEPRPDVILLVRGGGSYEDLMPFSDETLARAVAASPIPVVTGIGHEPDNSICDMVADRRCSTPTAAAEAVAPSKEELEEQLNAMGDALASSLLSQVQSARQGLRNLMDRPLWHDPHYLTGAFAQQLDGEGTRLARALPQMTQRARHQLELVRARLSRALPGSIEQRRSALSAEATRLFQAGQKQLAACSSGLSDRGTRLDGAARILLDGKKRQVSLAAAQLEALSPLKVLARGYSIAYAADGHTVVDSVEKVDAGERLAVQVEDGRIACTVDAVEKGASHD
ncbi:MAG: exodeoxyribonuclease VII large subunit [Coriobacteriales bacterium]|jgi:exodeoxyribonuclease VII large subunit